MKDDYELQDVIELVNLETFQNPLCRFERVTMLVEGYCIFELLIRDGEIILNNIRVNENDTCKGWGTQGLEWLKSIAERTRFVIKGNIESNGHRKLNNVLLKKWYIKNGFTIDGNNICYFPNSLYSHR